jgi:hypothetical protein
VYRHLLHNTLMREHDQFDVNPFLEHHLMQYTNSNQPSIIRLGILLLLFDVYLTWARIEKETSPESLSISKTSNTNFLRLAQQPIVFQYMFFRKPSSFPPDPNHSNDTSNTLRPLNPSLSHLYPIPYLIPHLPPRPLALHPPLLPPQLR